MNPCGARAERRGLGSRQVEALDTRLERALLWLTSTRRPLRPGWFQYMFSVRDMLHQFSPKRLMIRKDSGCLVRTLTFKALKMLIHYYRWTRFALRAPARRRGCSAKSILSLELTKCTDEHSTWSTATGVPCFS